MKFNVMVVDDEKNIRQGLGKALEMDGYQVQLASDGQEALELLRRERPRLVLLDVMMPRKTGFEVCQEIRQDDAIRDTLVLMLTAKGRETDIVKGLALGADAYMTKPFSTRELVLKVQELLACGGRAPAGAAPTGTG